MTTLLWRDVDPRAALRVLAIVLLNQLDAFCTLRHLAHGASELNPLMADLAMFGGARFVVVKHLLVSFGLLIFVTRADRKLARWGLAAAFGMFTCLALYHGALMLVT
jgi:hypothetical protein